MSWASKAAVQARADRKLTCTGGRAVGFVSLHHSELPDGLEISLAKHLLVLVDPLDGVNNRLLFDLEGRRQLPKADIVGANNEAKLLNLGAEENGLEIGGVDCVTSIGKPTKDQEDGNGIKNLEEKATEARVICLLVDGHDKQATDDGWEMLRRRTRGEKKTRKKWTYTS